MAVKLGSGSVTLRLGDATYPTKAYLGDTIVAATVPTPPVLTSIISHGGSPETVTVNGTIDTSDSNGGGLLGYQWEKDGVSAAPDSQSASPFSGTIEATFTASSGVFRVRAFNAIGSGPWSNIAEF